MELSFDLNRLMADSEIKSIRILAEKCKVHYTTMRKISSKQSASAKIIKKICDVFDKDPNNYIKLK